MTTTERKTYNLGGVMMPRPFKLRRLGHFGFNVEKMDECFTFYHDLLGFKRSDGLDFAGRPGVGDALKDVKNTEGHFFHYGTDHHAFVLFPKEAQRAMGRDLGELTINQITWQVGTLAEVVNGVEYFNEHGVTVERSGRDFPGSNWHTYVLDPDRHTNELYYGMEQIGWMHRSKPLPMHNRRFREVATLPQMSEEAEVETAMAEGVDVDDGFRDVDLMPQNYDVGGVMLSRPFKITKIGPVNIFVDDVATAKAFYMDRLGFQPTEDVTYEGETFSFLRIASEHHTLGLFPKSMRAKLGFSEHSTNASFGVEVGSYQQLRDAVAFLKENGARFLDVPPELHPGVDFAAYAIDPDGHAIQIYYYMEQLGWQGIPRPRELRRDALGEWPETLEALSDTYMDQVYQGPLG